MLLETGSRFQENKCEVAALRDDLKDHIQKDAVEAAVIFGFIDVGEEAHIVWDIDGKVVFPSPAFCKMVGVDTSEMVNGAWKEIIHPEDSRRVIEEWNKFIQGSLSTLKLKFRFYKQGSLLGQNPEILVQLKMVRKKVAIGGVTRIVGLFKRLDEVSQTREHHIDDTPISQTKSSSS